MKKLVTLTVLLLMLVPGHAQKFSFGAEYIPGFSSVTHPRLIYAGGQEGFAFSHQIFVKAGVALNDRISLTGGIGYMTSSQLQELQFLIPDIDDIKTRLSYQFYVASTGFRYRLGSLFFQPEIGVGIAGDVRNHQRTYAFGSVTESHNTLPKEVYQLTETVIPVSFSFGHEVDLKICTMDLGVKGYYFLNRLKAGELSPAQHAYGFGLILGVRM